MNNTSVVVKEEFSVLSDVWVFSVQGVFAFYYIAKSKAVPLHATKAFGGRGGIAATHSLPRH
jgi:hypothetical protein